MPQVGKRSKSKREQTINKSLQRKRRKKRVWKGPAGDGITQSLLSLYIKNPEHFRIRTIDGLKEKSEFSAAIEYGQMFHIAEELYRQGKDWVKPVTNYSRSLVKQFPLQGKDIQKWYNVVKIQFPIYIDFWKKHKSERGRKELIQEEVFAHPITLPSGRKIILRGKIDGASLIKGQLWMNEHKTKGNLDPQRIRNQLYFDLQCNMYGTVLQEMYPEYDFAGVNYNCIKRPLSGGVGTIRRHKATKNKPEETWEEYYARLQGIIEEHKESYFSRFPVTYNRTRLDIFRKRCLNPVLENLSDDYEWWCHCQDSNINHFDYKRRAKLFPKHKSRHFLKPVGLYDITAMGFLSPYDEYLRNGSTVGLERIETLFGEL